RYVSSESTALASVLGGGEAKPRSVSARESGVDGRPTLVSNVETYAHLALIARYGANWYRMAGAGSQPGTALFTVSGAVNNVGVYELPTGITGDTILRVAGGVREPLSGVLVGGYGGTWITPTELSRPVTDIGAGVFLAMPSRVCGLLEQTGDGLKHGDTEQLQDYAQHDQCAQAGALQRSVRGRTVEVGRASHRRPSRHAVVGGLHGGLGAPLAGSSVDRTGHRGHRHLGSHHGSWSFRE
ncbi:hypothetical protein ACFQ1S_09340, partial [Kibdelosporangium lantanae]